MKATHVGTGEEIFKIDQVKENQAKVFVNEQDSLLRYIDID